MSAGRWVDAAVSAVGLVVSAPFLLAACIWIRWDSPGSPFYGQTRIGRNGKPFTLFKLRSMRPVPELTSSITHGSGDPRITRPGRWLRRTKLDELPQLYNVLKGDMALVGPRPEVPEFVALYTEEQREVLRVRPGITDPVSLAHYDEAAELQGQPQPEVYYREVLMPRKLALQRAYLAQRTWRSDFGVVVATVRRMLRF
jgi:lipopolysaccharide/colanic/teichoic acid biosynthesis glycosyltransferase